MSFAHSGNVAAGDKAAPSTDATVPFRDIIPSPDHPKIAGISAHNARSWCDSRKEIPAPAWLIERLSAKNIEQPYIGFTADGKPDPAVYAFEPDEGAPVAEAKAAADKLVELLSESQRQDTLFSSVKDDAFRLWSNPELYVSG